MENRAHALAAGLFVLLLGLFGAFALWQFSQREPLANVFILTTTKNVIGLNIEAAVRYRGVRSGKVESIEQDKDDPRLLLVRIQLDPRFRLTRGTTARLGHQGITGLAYILLEDDGSSTEVLDGQADPPLRLPLQPSLFEVLGQRAEEVGGRAVAVLGRLERLMSEENERNLTRLLAGAAETAEAGRQLPAVIAALREVLSEANRKRFEATLSHLEQAASESAPLVQEARALMRSLTALAGRLENLAANGEAELNGDLLPRAAALLAELHRGSQRLNHLLATLDNAPQALIFGPPAAAPGPGEAGFVVPGH